MKDVSHPKISGKGQSHLNEPAIYGMIMSREKGTIYIKCLLFFFCWKFKCDNQGVNECRSCNLCFSVYSSSDLNFLSDSSEHSLTQHTAQPPGHLWKTKKTKNYTSLNVSSSISFTPLFPLTAFINAPCFLSSC